MSESQGKMKIPSWQPTISPKTDSLLTPRPFPLSVSNAPQVQASEDLTRLRKPQNGEMMENVRRYQQVGTTSPQETETTAATGRQLIAPPLQSMSYRIQPKLTIGEPGDRYEQEADQVASEVVQRINAPASVQRRELRVPPISSLVSPLDRFAQGKLKSWIQRQNDQGGGEATNELESSINSARGDGGAVRRLSLMSETYVQKSPVSVLAKQGVKAAAKKAIKEFIENQIKSRLKQYMSRQFAKQFVKDADDILNILDSSWWEIGIELIPIAGDIYGVGSFAKKLDKLWDKVKLLEKKVQLVTTAASKTIKKITLSSKLTGKGKDKLEAFTNKVNRLSDHLTEDDLAGAAKDILGEPVIIGGKKYDHLQEVNNALKGLGNQLDQLKEGIKKAEFEGDTLDEAHRLLSTLSNQKDEIQNVLNKVKSGI